MGNIGSTRWNSHRRRYTVESCIGLRLKAVQESIDLSTRVQGWTVIGWTSTSGAKYSVLAQFDTDQDNRHVTLRYGINGKPFHTVVRIVSTAPNYGGVRYWFECPQCERHCLAVYMPTYQGYTRFLCRHCHDLTYRSAQTAHEDDRGELAGVKMVFSADKKMDAAWDNVMAARAGSRRLERAVRKLERLHRQMLAGSKMCEVMTAGFK